MFALAAATALAGCGGDDGGPPDAGPPDLPEWRGDHPSASVIGTRRGLTHARGIIHLHSPYSHDACDGDPRAFNGDLDEDCLADLKAALCTTRQDYAVLTEHDDSMADEDFEDLFLIRGNDELILDGGDNPIAARIACENGHSFVLYTGGENRQMPIMIDRHPSGTIEQRHDTYNAGDAATMELWRTLGGMGWYAHTEEKDLDLLRTTQPDGFEIYNLHFNVLEPGNLQEVIQFSDTTVFGPEPDLAMLSFLSENESAISKWNTLLGEGGRFWGSGGTDAHQNVLPILLRDGERGDSYRRMIRWFSNVALVNDPTDHVQIEDAIRAGRFFVAFEIMGTPVGFDLEAEGVEMGGDVAVGTTITMTLPTVYEKSAELPEPVIRGRILRIDADGSANEVAEGTGPPISAEVTDGAVAYRAEVLITPLHWGPHLGNLGTAFAEREQVWIYSNPFYVLP